MPLKFGDNGKRKTWTSNL